MITLPRRLLENIRRHWQLYLMALPGLAIILLFNYVPMYGVQIAFRKYSFSTGFSGGQWVGWKYFEKLALLFNKIRNKRRQKLMQTVVYLPHFISTVVLVSIMTMMMSSNSGIIGQWAIQLGYSGVLMGDPELFVPIYVLSDIWQHAGWNSIIYIAALSSIDSSIYESCYIDGASTWQIVRYIDLPCLVPTMVVLLILTMGSVLGVGFEKVYLMQNSLNLSVSEIISTYVYKIGLQSNQYSYSAAISLFNNIINFFMVFLMNLIARKCAGISIW